MKTEIVKTEYFHNRKESDEELENGLIEMENMDFTGASCSSNPRNIRKTKYSSIKDIQRKIKNGEKTKRENVVKPKQEMRKNCKADLVR